MSGNALWITPARATSGLADVLACADPATGAIWASDTNPADAALAARPLSYHSKLYLPGGEGIAVITPPAPAGPSRKAVRNRLTALVAPVIVGVTGPAPIEETHERDDASERPGAAGGATR